MANTIKVKMLADAAGSPDHVTVILFKKDSVHDLPKWLAEVFIGEKQAMPHVEPALVQQPASAPEAPAQKQVAAAPENKAGKTEEKLKEADKQVRGSGRG